jgi:hypothetical protein
MERQVVFYECQDYADEPPFDRIAAVGGINDLDDDDWRVEDEDAEIGVIVDQVGSAAKPSYVRLLRIRADAPYILSKARKLSPIQVQQDESITEFTYAVIWPDHFMGAIASRDAPAHKRLALYFSEASDQETYIVNLFEPDVVQRLREMRRNGLRSVKLKVQTSYLRQIELASEVKNFSNLWNAGRGTDAATIGIELSVGRKRGNAKLKDAIARETERLAVLGDLFETMVVRGRDDYGDVQTINLKKERVRATIAVARSDSTAVVYREIVRARRAVEKQIKSLDRAARGS